MVQPFLLSDDGAILPAVAVAAVLGLAVAVVVLRLQPKGPPEDGVRNAGTAWWWSPFAFSEDRYAIVNKNSIPAAVLDSGQNYAVDVPAGTTELDENAFHNYQRLIRRVHQNTPWADWFGLPAWGLFVGLTEITLPDTLTHIGEQAFNGCSGLTEIAIPAGVTEIGMAAFCGCSGLTEIALPAGLREINFQVSCYPSSAKPHVRTRYPPPDRLFNPYRSQRPLHVPPLARPFGAAVALAARRHASASAGAGIARSLMGMVLRRLVVPGGAFIGGSFGLEQASDGAAGPPAGRSP